MSVEAAGIAGLLDAAVRRHPARTAVSDRDGRWTYVELDERSAAVAGWLRSQGVRAGDRVVLMCAADRHFIAALYACARVGAVSVPVDPRAGELHRAHILTDSAPRLVIADVPLEAPEDTLVCRAADVWTAAGAHRDDTAPAAGELAFLIYTSASTSPRPKAVAATHAAVLFAAAMIARRLAYRADDIVYCTLPLSFDYGLYQALLCASAGAWLVLRDSAANPRLLGDVRDSRATVVPLVPTLARMLVRLAGRDPAATAVRLFTNTGEDLPAQLIAQLRDSFPGAGVHLMYGITECKRVSILECDGDRLRPGSVGRPLDGTEVTIVDDAGTPVPPGTLGEIVVRGPHVMAGYWRRAAETTFRLGPDGPGRLLFTGDFGHLDTDGYLYFHGRRDDLFKLRGVRTSAVEIEAAATGVPGVDAAAVLVPTAARGPVLLVTGRITAADLTARLRARIGAAKVPDECRVVASIPQNANGKVDRARLAAEYDQ